MTRRQRNSALVSRNLVVSGKRTSIRLEPELWAALEAICEDCGLTRHQLASRISARRPGGEDSGAFTSAVRVAVLAYYRASSGPGRIKPAAILEVALDALGGGDDPDRPGGAARAPRLALSAA